ncbi:Esterase FE4 precursor, putative [Gryllus bimaculatus]|nr:Esterase FE4 precursor, putative [Gryllus bimaculatus]
MAKMAEEFVNVRVSHGALRGRKVTAKAGNSYFSFQGIPYAKPPVGPLRFQVAQPVEPWGGVRDALKEGPSCPQIEWIKKLPYFGDEDCLYVNVYSPQLPSIKTPHYPVMVWIHGGGFEVGNGDADMYGPEYLVGGNVVVVTINYRLGIFGFLKVDDASVPGNVGLKDQVAALRWVKENILVFGGDPNNVTIFGESAGGASVHYHLLSPMSQGLFHKAILQSGCALNPWASSVQSQELTFKLARELGSDASNAQELLSFLRSVPARDLVEKEHELQKMVGEIFPRFIPTPEEYAPGPGDEIFLPAHPKEMMEKRQYNSVPVMVGATSNEGIIILDRASHLDDVGYLFATPFFKVPEVAPDSFEAITRKRMVKLWTDFAKTGNPTPDLDSLIGVKWPAYKTPERMYLNINDTLYSNANCVDV